MRPGHRLLLPALALFLLIGCSGRSPKSPPGHGGLPGAPDDSRARLEYVLDTSGENRAELEAALSAYAPGTGQAERTRFLVRNLPPADRASMTADEFREIVDVAALARASLPWGKEAPEDIFRRWVLPHRVAQEPFQPSRKAFFDELAPLVANSTVQEAVARVNHWCFSKMGFRTTSRWDQGPLTSISRGFGRCEEAAILAVLALRSVAIPARMAGTPAWRHVDDNHVWVEVWISGKWVPMEAADPYKELTGNRLKAALVRTVAYGHAAGEGDEVISRGFGSTVLNLTPDYVPVWTLEASLVGSDGDPLEGTDVFVSVFNYGGFRPIARLRTDGRGRASVKLGQGSYLLTAARDNQTDFAVVTNLDPVKRKRSEAELDLRRDRFFSGQGPMPFSSPVMDQVVEKGYGALPFPVLPPSLPAGKGKEESETARRTRFQGLELLMERFAEDRGSKEAASPLKAARGAGPGLALAMERSSDPARFARYLGVLEDKDLASLSPQQAAREPVLAAEARARARVMGVHYNDPTYRDFILNPRVEYEPLSFWRPALKERFADSFGKGVLNGIREVNRLLASLPEPSGGYLGPIMTPEQVLVAGAARPGDKLVFAAAALRAAGIPARYNSEWDFAEYYDENSWAPLFADRPDILGNHTATEDSARYYAAPCRVLVRFFEKGRPLTGKEMRYFRDFSVARFTEAGFFLTVEKTIEGSFEDDSPVLELRLPPGRYWLFAARRNDQREPMVTAVPFQAEAGEEITLQAELLPDS